MNKKIIIKLYYYLYYYYYYYYICFFFLFIYLLLLLLLFLLFSFQFTCVMLLSMYTSIGILTSPLYILFLLSHKRTILSFIHWRPTLFGNLHTSKKFRSSYKHFSHFLTNHTYKQLLPLIHPYQLTQK